MFEHEIEVLEKEIGDLKKTYENEQQKLDEEIEEELIVFINKNELDKVKNENLINEYKITKKTLYEEKLSRKKDRLKILEDRLENFKAEYSYR